MRGRTYSTPFQDMVYDFGENHGYFKITRFSQDDVTVFSKSRVFPKNDVIGENHAVFSNSRVFSKDDVIYVLFKFIISYETRVHVYS